MVYASWMNQAADGHFFMDNRFAVDPQPGLTVNLYFFVLGLVSKLFGIGWTCALARAALSFCFVLLLHRFLRRIQGSEFFVRTALILTVFGGGLGFLVWHNFGEAIVRPTHDSLNAALLGRLPTDVWQPEAFVFPSMLVNGLFVFALCLILLIFGTILDSRESWKPVPLGFCAAFLLMNTHSYDVLLVVFVLFAFLCAQVFSGQIKAAWLGRGLAILSGTVIPAIWFLYVLKSDPVFQARAATETFSPNFRQIVFGYGLLLALGIAGFALRGSEGWKARRWIGLVLVALLTGAAWIFSADHVSGYWMGWPAWIGIFVVGCGACALLATESPGRNLVQAWAIVGLAAPYFPMLFQRKLSMGLAVPWAILASLALVEILEGRARTLRSLVAAAVGVLVCATSFRWIIRELDYIHINVARTTLQPVFFDSEVRKILEALRSLPGRNVVVAMPGISGSLMESGDPVPELFGPPLMPDLNPLAAGYGLAYAYAGHWSETPDYLSRRRIALRLFLGRTPEEERFRILTEIGATHLIAPVPEAFSSLTDNGRPLIEDMRPYGKTLAGGKRFVLIELARPGGAIGD